MRKEYDFSHGERGKFYRPNAEFHLPVYLEPDIETFLREIAEHKQIEVEEIVNDWLRRDMGIIQTAR
jgi:hypothetical protein